MDPTNGRALPLARRLRELREQEWRDVTLTQTQLAGALSAESKVAPTTISSWESSTNPKTPPVNRISGYARFFATRKSLIGEPHLIPEDQLDDNELERFREIEQELLGLHPALGNGSIHDSRRALLSFPGPGPVVIICPEAPPTSGGPLAGANELNFPRLHRYADLDALIEMFGHIRALNPAMHVLFRVPSEIQHAELQNHLVVLGGVGWNSTVRRTLSAIKILPIEQVDDPEHPQGEIFRMKTDDGRPGEIFAPIMESENGTVEQVEDVALIARLPNPFNTSCTLTICNGVYSRGVVGAVLTGTDETVRPANEKYLAQRFPEGSFAMLVRVPVVDGRVLAPDLQNPETRLFEWAPGSADRGTGPRVEP